MKTAIKHLHRKKCFKVGTVVSSSLHCAGVNWNNIFFIWKATGLPVFPCRCLALQIGPGVFWWFPGIWVLCVICLLSYFLIIALWLLLTSWGPLGGHNTHLLMEAKVLPLWPWGGALLAHIVSPVPRKRNYSVPSGLTPGFSIAKVLPRFWGFQASWVVFAIRRCVSQKRITPLAYCMKTIPSPTTTRWKNLETGPIHLPVKGPPLGSAFPVSRDGSSGR